MGPYFQGRGDKHETFPTKLNNIRQGFLLIFNTRAVQRLTKRAKKHTLLICKMITKGSQSHGSEWVISQKKFTACQPYQQNNLIDYRKSQAVALPGRRITLLNECFENCRLISLSRGYRFSQEKMHTLKSYLPILGLLNIQVLWMDNIKQGGGRSVLWRNIPSVL